ncbi:MAG: hypothetical protein IAF08_07685 [Rhizobacter sp.]|nr:hypothetical protein [Chlorobiales bacterium]
MENRISKLLFILAAIYIVSQVVLLMTIGKDLELILLSLGVFIALSVCVALGAPMLTLPPLTFPFGRVKLESVSMRRAKAASHERETGEFTKMGNGFEGSKRLDRYYDPSDSVPQPRLEASQPVSGSSFAALAAETGAGQVPELAALEHAIVDKAAMFGGLTAVRAMMDKMDDDALSGFMRQMGYTAASAAEVRTMVHRLANGNSDRSESNHSESHRSHSDGGASDQSKSGLQVSSQIDMKPAVIQKVVPPVPRDRLKTSLDGASFGDYMRRCMSGNDTSPEVNMISLSIRPDAAGPDTVPEFKMPSITVLRRMSGIRTGGGLMKCSNCRSYDALHLECSRMRISVELNNVCDGWQEASS